MEDARRGPGLPCRQTAGADRYPEHISRRQRCRHHPEPTKHRSPRPRTSTSQGTTPYEDYVQADVLTHLQHPLSDDPGEMVFLVTTQVMELWFTVIVHEWETAARALREDDVPVARRRAEALRYGSWRR